MTIDTRTIGIPLSARPSNDPRKFDLIAGLESAHGALQNGIDSIYKLSYELTADKALEHAFKATIGSQKFDGGKDVVGFIRQFDPNNESGAVGFGLQLIDKIRDSIDAEKFLEDTIGTQAACLMGIFTDLNGLTAKLRGMIPDLKAMIAQKINEIVDKVYNAINTILAPIQNALMTAAEFLQQAQAMVDEVLNLAQKIQSCFI